MYYYVSGEVAHVEPYLAVIDCGGVGYACRTTTFTLSQIKKGDKAKLFTYLSVREDAMDLYGFASAEELKLFQQLISVSGVGPKAGLSILSILSPEKVALAVSSGDHKAFTKASGVGPKLAQRITLELKDKVGKGLAVGAGFSGAEAAPPPSSAPAQAVAALISLGYSPSDAASAVARVDDTLSVQDIIKIALRSLSRA